MSILSTFGILFQTDADDATKEVDGLDKSLGNLEQTAEDVAGAVDDMDGAVNDSAEGFLGLADGVGTAAAGLVVLTGLFAGLTSQAMSTDEIGKFSETLGLSIEDVGAWGEAVKRSGGDANAFRGTIASLTDKLTDMDLTGGGEGAEVFARLGINARDASGKIKDAFSILPELADSFQNLSKAESVGFGRKLGLDQGTILLLQQGRVAVEDLVNRQKQLGVATEEDYLAAAKFNDAWADTQQIFSNLATSSGTTILPLLNTMLSGLENIVSWMKENDTLVEGFFIGAGAAITYFYLPAIISAGAATLVAISPFLLIGAAIAAVGVAFALLYEDVVAYLGGQSSFIGDLAAEYEWFGDIVDSVINGIAMHFRGLEAVFDWLINLIKSPTKAIEDLGESVKKMVNEAKELIPDIGDSFDDAFSGFKSFFGMGDDEIKASLDKAVMITNGIDRNQLNGQTSASIVNSQQSINRTTTVSVGGTTVNTQATDPQAVANEVNGTLKNQVAQAIGNFQDGEAY